MKRAEKINLLSALLASEATPKQIETLRKSREPIHLTLIIDDDGTNTEPSYPTYHIEVRGDGTGRSYWKHEDGRIEVVK